MAPDAPFFLKYHKKSEKTMQNIDNLCPVLGRSVVEMDREKIACRTKRKRWKKDDRAREKFLTGLLCCPNMKPEK